MKKQMFNDVYEIHRNKIIGQGAFATVFMATHRPSSRVVAVKVVHSYINNKEKNVLIKLLDL